jgi:hypothetical protein
MADKRDQDQDSFSLESLVERASSRPPAPGDRGESPAPPPGGEGRARSAAPAGGGAQRAQKSLAGSREAISAWGSPTLSSMRPPAPPSHAVPLAILAGFALLSASVFAAFMVFRERPAEEPKPEIARVEPVVRTVAVKPSGETTAAASGEAPAEASGRALSAAAVERAGEQAEQPPRPEGKREAAEEPAQSRDSAPVPDKPNKIRAAVVIRPAGGEPSAGGKGEAAAARAADVGSSPAPAPSATESRASSGPAGGRKRAQAGKDDTGSADELPEQPSREQILAAMKEVEEPVRQCAQGQGGTVVIVVKVAGKTGAVQSVSVDGVEGSVGLCIAREVYRARFPSFAKPVFTVRYPLAL